VGGVAWARMDMANGLYMGLIVGVLAGSVRVREVGGSNPLSPTFLYRRHHGWSLSTIRDVAGSFLPPDLLRTWQTSDLTDFDCSAPREHAGCCAPLSASRSMNRRFEAFSRLIGEGNWPDWRRQAQANDGCRRGDDAEPQPEWDRG
jgi:hypothetical protein